MEPHKYLQGTISNIKQAGFRVFIAESGNYGFYTNKTGTRVVSFQVNLGSINFSGNYKAPRGSSYVGNGWRIADANRKSYSAMLSEYPPAWATRGYMVSMTTLEAHLALYGKTSKYSEV